MKKDNHRTVKVYVDEAGDLGFTAKSTKTFLVAYLILNNPWWLRRDLNRLRKKLNFKGNEFKFSRDSNKVREVVLEKIRANEDIKIGVVAIDKSYVKQELRDKPETLYNYLVVHYTMINLKQYKLTSIALIVDKALQGVNLDRFNYYVQQKVDWLVNNNKYPAIHIEHKDSQTEPCIQAADYVAGACFRRFEHNDTRWYNYIKDKIIFRNSWGNINW